MRDFKRFREMQSYLQACKSIVATTLIFEKTPYNVKEVSILQVVCHYLQYNR